METTKEKLLEFWQGVEAKTGLKISYGERVTGITPRADGSSFDVQTNKSSYVTRAVMLTIGRRGTPRTLGVPGEELSKVVYRLIDPEQYQGQHVLVVGGGDSALEVAHSIAEQPGTTVTISYRSDSFSRAKPKNRDKVGQMNAGGQLNMIMSSNVREIRADSVVIDQGDESIILPNSSIIVCAGGILPTGFLRDVGVQVETKFGSA